LISFAAAEIGRPGEKDKKFSVFSTSDERIVYSKSMYKPLKDKVVDDDFDDIADDEILEEEILKDDFEMEDD
jgi:hypothetical protein